MVEDDQQRASLTEGFDAQRDCLLARDGVVYNADGPTGGGFDLLDDLFGGESAVDDVRCSIRFDQLRVVKRCSSDDRTESRPFRELDGCAICHKST